MENSYSDYRFNRNERIGNDELSTDLKNIQNKNYTTYLLTNFGRYNDMGDIINVATEQPGINYTGYDSCGSTIDDSSKLMIGQIQTKINCSTTLFQRPFVTVPYLGRGAVNPTIEREMMIGDATTLNKKSENQLGEKMQINRQFTPLIPDVKTKIQNFGNVTMEKGISSRDCNKDQVSYK